MVRSVQHEMLAQPTHDEAARQQFVVAFKLGLNRSLRSSQQRLFDEVVAPEYRRHKGIVPASREEIREAMTAHPAWRTWSTLARSAQEAMWQSIGDSIYRERERLSSASHRLASAADRRGSLELDPSFVPPRGVTAVDIHLQTGGYALDLGPDDVVAGAFYESGGNLYASGQGVSKTDSKAAHVQRFIASRYPDLAPTRILDMGCSAGAASVPYAQAFPDAEVHAIDVGAGMLRYAHARAESLGAAVHFHQRDCAATGFPDAWFDLVVSHNMMHEISEATRRGMLRETWRILRPGGVFVHQDVPLRLKALPEFLRWERSWDTRNNNEPFWEVYGNADLRADMLEAGIPEDCLWEGSLPQAPGSLPWFVATARRPIASK